jgi:hypothetical protein
LSSGGSKKLGISNRSGFLKRKISRSQKMEKDLRGELKI